MKKAAQDKANFQERRRQLLKLGAAGMPMVLTLKASAASPLHSALDCLISIPSGLCILVNHEGACWVSTSYQHSGQKLTNGKVQQFISGAEYILPAGSVPESYRPEECQEEDDSCGDGWGDDDDGHGGGGGGWGDDDDGHGGWGLQLSSYSSGSGGYGDDHDDDDDDDDNNGCSSGDDDDDHRGKDRRGGGWRDDDDDHDDDDDGGSGSGGGNNEACGYKLYCFEDSVQFAPGNFVGSNGAWTLSGDLGLYTIVAAKYGEYYGTGTGFPGVSCLMSILTYLHNS